MGLLLYNITLWYSKCPNACLLSCLCCCPTVLEPGRYAAAMGEQIITSTAACLLDFYCPGGDPTAPFDPNDAGSAAAAGMTTCEGNKATFIVGATSSSDCRE